MSALTTQTSNQFREKTKRKGNERSLDMVREVPLRQKEA
jgi:hypothetical protein